VQVVIDKPIRVCLKAGSSQRGMSYIPVDVSFMSHSPETWTSMTALSDWCIEGVMHFLFYLIIVEINRTGRILSFCFIYYYVALHTCRYIQDETPLQSHLSSLVFSMTVALFTKVSNAPSILFFGKIMLSQVIDKQTSQSY